MHTSDVISRLTGIGYDDPLYHTDDDEANYFARCLLMPAELVKAQIEVIKADNKLRGVMLDSNMLTFLLAKAFVVDETMMAMRLVEIHADL